MRRDIELQDGSNISILGEKGQPPASSQLFGVQKKQRSIASKLHAISHCLIASH